MNPYEPLNLKELYNHQSKYQHIKVIGNDFGKVLFLDNVVQLTTWDCHRYHECIAIVPYLFTRFAENVLILGGGDGYAAKTLLDTFPNIKRIVMVELDEEVVKVSRGFFEFPNSEKLSVIHQDAREWVRSHRGKKAFGLVIADYTDPSFAYAARLFTVEHLKDIKELMTTNGVFSIQMVSPFTDPRSASCLVATVNEAFSGYQVYPYRVHMPMNPAPAQQGFCMASPQPLQLQVPPKLKFLNALNFNALFWLDNDETYGTMPASTEKNLLYHRLCSSIFDRDIKEWETEWEK